MSRPEPRARPACPILLAAVLGLGGCATSSIDLAPARSDSAWQPRTDESGEILAAPPSLLAGKGKAYTLPANRTLAQLPPAAALDPAHDYDLPELIDLAQSSNPRAFIAWDAARNAALAVGIGKSAYLPYLAATAMGGYIGGHGSGSASFSGESSSSSSRSTLRAGVAALSLQWLLFDFGGRDARVQAAEQAAVVANVALTGVHQQIIHEVSVAYYQYDAARARTGNFRRTLADAGVLLAAAQARYKRGVGTVIETAQAEQNVAQARLALVSAQGAESDAYLGLVTALGISPLSKPRIAALPDRPLPPDLDVSVDAYVAEALARRPDVLGAYAAMKAEQARARAAESAFLPKIFLSASTSYNASRSSIDAIPAVGQQSATVNLDNRRFGSSVLLGVTVPIYDGGLRSAVLMQARNDAASAEHRLARTRDEAARQIVAGRNALRTSLASHEAAAALMKAARTTYDAALAAYRNGVGTLTEATQAQDRILLAENACTDSYRGALSAIAGLALATGEVDAPSTASP
ncbi:TolC family protein [Achromobacter aloeverae]